MKRWLYKIKPVDKARYLERCKALRDCLDAVEVMPAFLVCNMCLFVLHRAFGSKWRVVVWLLIHIANDCWDHWKDITWTTWHMYITCKSLPEIRELVDQELERLTGDDHREWPDVVCDEEVAEIK